MTIEIQSKEPDSDEEQEIGEFALFLQEWKESGVRGKIELVMLVALFLTIVLALIWLIFMNNMAIPGNSQ